MDYSKFEKVSIIKNSTAILTDCMDFMRGLPDGFFDLVIADPPYGIGDTLTIGGTWSVKYQNKGVGWDIKPPSEFFDEIKRVSKNQIVWGGNYFPELKECRCYLIWDKVAKMDSLADSEFAWTSFDSNAKTFSHVRNTTEKRIHITQKPVALYKWLLTNYAKPGHKIFDPMMGSQSSRIAAYDMGFDYWGCELDADYYREGEARFKAHTAKPVLFAPQEMYYSEQTKLF